jgi:adenosine kinase
VRAHRADLEQSGLTGEGLVVTRGGEGSLVYTDGGCLEIPAAKAREIRDPTGCGDAYRAGLLHGLMRDMDWETTGRIASLMGAIKIEYHGTQNHRFDKGRLRRALPAGVRVSLLEARYERG